ncbi:MAG TPA: Uma2 family endonuclease [Stellaceae bacterium]|nr:Uma2 family endonuclease [Stellaceae bacterium]
MATKLRPYYTVEEYLALEREADHKSEYLAGQIYAMAGGSPQHNQIGFNLITALGVQLLGGHCRGYTSDQRVLADELYTYPDITVVCGEPRFEEGDPGTLTNPTLLVEVLSASTEAYDRGDKFAHYRRIESLQEYVLVSQAKPHIERFLRRDDGEWLFTAVEGLEATLRMTSIGCELRLAQVYDRVEFEGEPPAKA